MVNVCTATPEQNRALEVARIGFMSAAPFYSHLFYSEMKEVLTKDIPTLATDGRHIYINPEYLVGLKPPEAVFALTHEVVHFVCRHPARMAAYKRDGMIKDTPFDQEQFNRAADYVVNAGLMEEGIGMMNPSWLYDPDTTGEDLVEDVYRRIYKKPPQDGSGTKGKTYAESGKAPRGARRDKVAEDQGGAFDSLLPPPVDPVTGKVDAPDEAEFKEAVARAAAAAKAMGKLPASIQRMIDAILAPQIDWREHVRLLLTGHMGARHETWNRPNRRRLVLNPLVIMPGRRGYGAECVAVGIDTSGSIGEKELAAFFSEVGGVLADIRPKKVVVIFCDARVQRVDEVASLDELAHVRVRGAPGGGGTDFTPVFDYIRDHDVRPETLIYITDLFGRFPYEAPSYPTVWCATTDQDVPFGEVVRIEV